MPAPTFLCIGAQKGGTSWLSVTMRQHPGICITRKKEMHFFDKREAYGRGLAWYEAQFECAPGATAIGELTPSYLWTVGEEAHAATRDHWLGVADRVRAAYPDLRLLVCLRDPVERAVSSYFHAIHAGHIPPSTSLLNATRVRAGIREMGRYADQLERWMALFPREQFLFLVYEDDIRPDAAKPATLARVFTHLGVDPTFVPEGVTRLKNARRSHFDLRLRHASPWVQRAMRRLPARVRSWPLWTIPVAEADTAALARLYAPDVARLETLLGRALPWATAPRAAR